jgi:parvulin-like peptidyl-prolyl isomerase
MRIVRVACVLVVLLAACGDALEPRAAVVNGNAIEAKQIETALDSFVTSEQFDQLTQSKDPEQVKREYEQVVLSRLIRREVLAAEAEAAGIEVTDQDVADRMEQIRADFENEKEFLAEIERQGLTLEEVEGLVRDSLIEERLREEITGNVEPTTAEVESFYDESVERFTEVRTAHILVETNKEAINVLERLEAAPQDEIESTFADLAKEFSIDEASAKNGGDLGYQNPSGFVPEYSQALGSLDEGEITETPVRSQFGFHIIRLIDRRVTPFEEVREQLTEELRGQQQEDEWTEFLGRAYEEADVDINSRYGVLDPETFLVVNADGSAIPGGEEPPPRPTPDPNAPQPAG